MKNIEVAKNGIPWRGGLLAAVLIGTAACSIEVVNPGRVQEEFLGEVEAQEAIVAGIGRAVAEAHNYVGYTGAAVTREVHPSGSTGSFGIQPEWQNGELDYETVNTHWNLSQRARWWGDDGIAKITETGAEDQALLAEAYLWAGYANRLLGENFCMAVIDGGGAQDRSIYYSRAIERFSQAASLGSGDMSMAAVAARASVKAFMGDWAGAVADAATVPDGFVWNLPYFATEGNATRNRIQFASQNEPYKAHTVKFTKYEDYGMSENNPNGDPRIPFRITDETGDAAVQCCGQVPWWPQTKYEDSGSDIPLSKGTEMRLIEAEAMLQAGDWQGAMGKINALRMAAGVEPAMATSAVEGLDRAETRARNRALARRGAAWATSTAGTGTIRPVACTRWRRHRAASSKVLTWCSRICVSRSRAARSTPTRMWADPRADRTYLRGRRILRLDAVRRPRFTSCFPAPLDRSRGFPLPRRRGRGSRPQGVARRFSPPADGA